MGVTEGCALAGCGKTRRSRRGFRESRLSYLELSNSFVRGSESYTTACSFAVISGVSPYKRDSLWHGPSPLS